ncbi:MAG TPA: glycogen-binding domain-containing protein [Longimicrobiales bacterium]
MAGSVRRASRLGIRAASCLFIASPAAAQWHAEVQAGRLQYDAAPEAVTTSFAAGISWSNPWSMVAGSVGTPFTSEEPVWFALQGSHRIASRGDLGFGLDLGADAFVFHLSTPDPDLLPDLFGSETTAVTGWGAAAEAMPFVGWRAGNVHLEARAGVASLLSDGTHIEEQTRTAFVADAFAETAVWRSLVLRGDGRWVSASEGGFPYAGVTVAWEGPFALWGSVGQWFDPAAESLSWRAGVALPVGNRVALLLNGEHEEIDPVHATPARTTWGAGVRVMLGALARVSEPLPDAYVDGVATISLDAEATDARTPSIAGDFNDWTPAPMTRDETADAWTFRIPVAPGVYHYSFVDADGNWFVPEGTPGRRSDGMGGYVAVLVVEER